MNIPKIGTRWRHYKSTGGDDYTYEVLGISIHSETLEEMVIYKMLYDSKVSEPGYKAFPKGTIFVRPLSMWFDKTDFNGEKIQRFMQIT